MGYPNYFARNLTKNREKAVFLTGQVLEHVVGKNKGEILTGQVLERKK